MIQTREYDVYYTLYHRMGTKEYATCDTLYLHHTLHDETRLQSKTREYGRYGRGPGILLVVKGHKFEQLLLHTGWNVPPRSTYTQTSDL
jgi:hypothetical protein